VGQYNQNDRVKERGFSFGVGREKYKKNFVPGMRSLNPDITKYFPGPNHYDQKLNDFGK